MTTMTFLARSAQLRVAVGRQASEGTSGVNRTRINCAIYPSNTEELVVSDLSLRTWNVYNLLPPPAADATILDRFQRKLASLAALLDPEQPDLLPLQEIGTDGAVHPGLLKGDGRSTDACG